MLCTWPCIYCELYRERQVLTLERIVCILGSLKGRITLVIKSSSSSGFRNLKYVEDLVRKFQLRCIENPVGFG